MKKQEFKTLLYLDIESLGLCGKTMLIQYAIGERGKIVMFRPDKDPEKLAFLLNLLEQVDTLVIIYNVPFDMNKLYQLYGKKERFKCSTLDLQIHAKLSHPMGKYSFSRKGDRAIAAVKMVPKIVAGEVKEFIQKEIQKTVPKQVIVNGSTHDVKGDKGKDFVNLSFSLQASLRLKNLMKYYGEKTTNIDETDWPVPPKKVKGMLPHEYEDSHNPFEQPIHKEIEPLCEAVLDDPKNSFWKYAEDDVRYLQVLYRKLNRPEPTYNDAVAHIVAFTYIIGFPLDLPILREFLEEADAYLNEALDLPFDVNSSKQKVAHFNNKYPKMKLTNCDKYVLERLANRGDEDAIKIVNYGALKQQRDQAYKLLNTGDNRAHPMLNVIGTATQRMAGASGFNYQGIGKKSPIRKAILCSSGGDFSGLEIALMATIYNDKTMQEELATGKDIHLATAVIIHPKLEGKVTYEEAVKLRAEGEEAVGNGEKPTKMQALVIACRTETKAIVFGSAYGASAYKIAETVNITLEAAEELLYNFYEKYSGMRDFKEEMQDTFCTGDTEDWTKDSVEKMRRSVVDTFGYERSFDFETETAILFWKMAFSKSKSFKEIFWKLEDYKLTRRDEKGPQNVQRCVMSAFLGAALTIQGAVARSATNSIVQSSGAQTTKMLMVHLWEKFGVPMLNIHDEVIIPQGYEHLNKAILEEVQVFIKSLLWKFPYLAMDFKEIGNWSER